MPLVMLTLYTEPMRIWSVHPSQLDAKGLVACWRETLLAQKVLQGLTKGYTNHPQLKRFRLCADPVQAVATYLHIIADEADARGYNFDRTRIVSSRPKTVEALMPVTQGQLDYEFDFLRQKVEARDKKWFATHFAKDARPEAHPLFYVIPGDIEEWEHVKNITK